MRSWWASYQRFASSPGAVAASLRMHLDVDVRRVLPDIAVPTLIVHRTRDMLVPVECSRFIATRIAGARYLEQPGEDHMYWLGDQDATLSAIRGFLAGTPDGAPIAALRQSRRRPAAGWESLTGAEMDIVRLVAAGMTNRQIAARLYLSPRTVQTHVSHVMRKLGVARRSEIAAETSRRQRLQSGLASGISAKRRMLGPLPPSHPGCDSQDQPALARAERMVGRCVMSRRSSTW
jgi:DNA-binding CsgD family transcriptional regulator